MIDLSKKAAESHWQGTSALMHSLLSRMESNETWALDAHPAIVDAIEEWDANHSESLVEQSKASPDQFIRFLSFISVKLAMKIIQELERQSPGATSDLLYECLQNSSEADDDRRHQQIFRDRLIAISHMGALDRIFSRDRLDLVARVIEDTAKYHGAVYENI